MYTYKKEYEMYTYKKNGSCKYYGRCFLTVERTSNDQYRISEAYLATNECGKLGFIGKGTKWFLNYATGEGNCCFNPISPESLLWSPYHNAYILKSEQEHFLYPVIVGEFYHFTDGVKYNSYFGKGTPMIKLPKFSFKQYAGGL